MCCGYVVGMLCVLWVCCGCVVGVLWVLWVCVVLVCAVCVCVHRSGSAPSTPLICCYLTTQCCLQLCMSVPLSLLPSSKHPHSLRSLGLTLGSPRPRSFARRAMARGSLELNTVASGRVGGWGGWCGEWEKESVEVDDGERGQQCGCGCTVGCQ